MPPHYRELIDRLHQPSTRPAPRDAHGRPYLVLELVNTGERIEVAPQNSSGSFSALDRDRLAHALRDVRQQTEHPLDADLLDLVYATQLHYRSEAIRVISGYRTPRAGSGSNHGRGRAIDIIVPGAKDEDVAAFLRSKGFVGVGVYPQSGFVHLDVRPSSYYWIDRSGPGQRKAEQATFQTEAAVNDARARAAGLRAPRAWAQPAASVDAIWQQPENSRQLVSSPLDSDGADDLDLEP